MTDRWPTTMTRKTALEYLDMGETAFEREIAQGRLPDGVLFGGKLRWYRAALDKAIAAIAGEVVDDEEAEFWRKYGDKAA